MKEYQISPINLSSDIAEISNWDIKFQNDPRYDSIKNFILEDNIYYGLGEVIETNYEIFPIGKNERKYALALRNNQEIMGFALAIAIELETPDPELILQYIVLNPDYQHKAIGFKFLNELINNSEKYFDAKFSSVFTRIHNQNTPSLKTFKKLGFTFTPESDKYVVANLNILENYNE